MTTLNTIIEEEKKSARDWFTSEYCVKRPAQGIRWIRSIFFDDYDQITKILESHDRAITTAMQRAYEAGRRDTVEEISRKLPNKYETTDHASRRANLILNQVQSILKDMSKDI